MPSIPCWLLLLPIGTAVSSGTLVVAVPAKDGLVVAADSRTTAAGEFIDGKPKLGVAGSSQRLLFTITGISEFIDPPPPGTSIREWIRVAPVRYDGAAFVNHHLRDHPIPALTESALASVGTALAASVTDYFRRRPAAAVNFRGRELCRLGLFQFDERRLHALLGSALIVVDDSGAALAQPPVVERIRQDDPKRLWFMGEDQYAKQHVLSGVGGQFIPRRVAPIWNGARYVRDLDTSQAAEFARGFIVAAAMTTALVPVPSGNGIGGRVDVYILTSGAAKAVE